MGLEADIISVPEYGKREAKGENEKGFAYFEDQGRRPTQEDALVALDGLEDQKNLQSLTPEQVGQRLWSAHMQLDAETRKLGLRGGTTASSNYYDGKGNIVTATLADAAAFAVVYGKDRSVLKVVRLNSITHKPTDPAERERIEGLGGAVFFGRVNGSLALSRAIGDHDFRGKEDVPLVCAESQVDITSIDNITSGLIKDEIGSIELISTCDGFTDAAPNQTKDGHEAFLKKCLESETIKGKKGQELCEALAKKAIANYSTDNVSVALQTIYSDGKPSDTPAFFGIYDGHGGPKTSEYVAQNMGKVFRAQCALTEDLYAENEYSVKKHQKAFDREHKKVTPTGIPSHDTPETPVMSPSPNPLEEDKPVLNKDAVKILLEDIDFDTIMQNFKNLETTLPKGSKEFKALHTFITNVEAAKETWLQNPKKSQNFIDACRQHAEVAQKSPLKNYVKVNALFKIFIKAINWLASFVFKEPLIKTKTYKDLAFFKGKVEEVAKDKPEDKPESSLK